MQSVNVRGTAHSLAHALMLAHSSHPLATHSYPLTMHGMKWHNRICFSFMHGFPLLTAGLTMLRVRVWFSGPHGCSW